MKAKDKKKDKPPVNQNPPPGRPGNQNPPPNRPPGNQNPPPNRPPVNQNPPPNRPGNNPGRPDDTPGRPGNQNPPPGRPGNNPGRPGNQNPPPGRPGNNPGRPGNNPGRPGNNPGRPGNNPGRPDDTPDRPRTTPNIIDNFGEGVDANRGESIIDAREEVKLNNPDIINPLGESSTKINPDGTVSIEQKLSPEQDDILKGGQGITRLGQQLGSDQLKTIAGGPTYRDAINYDPIKAETAVYDSLTRGVAEKNTTALNNLSQQLYNRGLQPGTEAYNQQYKLLAESQNNFDLGARNQATLTGLTAQNQFFNQNETQTANDLNKYNNTINSAGALSNLGTGLLMPSFQPFQGSSISGGTPTDIYTQLNGIKQGNRQLDISQQGVNNSGGGGGGGGGGAGITPEQQLAADRKAAGFA